MALALVAVSLAPLAVLPYLLALNRDGMTDQVLRTHALAARTTAERVGTFLDSIRGPADTLAANPQVQQAPRSDAARGLFSGVLEAHDTLVAIAVSSPEGAEVIRVQKKSHAESAASALALPHAGSASVSRDGAGLWLRLEVPLPEGRGTLVVVADGRSLETLARPEELGEDAVVAVASGRELIASSGAGVTIGAFPAALVAAGASGALSGAGRYPGAAGEVLGAYAPVPHGSWYVLSRQPALAAEQVAVRMQRQSWLAVGIALALTGLLSLAAYRSVVAPIRSLAEAQGRLARGAGAARPRDEIEALKATFALLERQSVDRSALGDVFLGRYQVLDVVGTGGMGTVFKGWDPRLQRLVALKTVRLSEAAGRGRHEGMETLLREAVMVARLSHPNIVAVHDVEDHPEAAFIAMEFVPGTSLAHLIDAGPVAAGQAVPIVAAVARGLQAAHARRLVHRDVKPANVLLGRDGAIKVTDFGVADLVSSVVTDADLVFGTPGYLPPEAIAGRGHDALGDLFALGVVLYEAIVGSPPFASDNVDELLRLTLEAVVPPLATRAPGVPLALGELVSQLLEKEPSRRPQGAGLVAQRLEEIAKQHAWKWSAIALDALPEVLHEAQPSRVLRIGATDTLAGRSRRA
jgi:serine/threonine-protein kinase